MAMALAGGYKKLMLLVIIHSHNHFTALLDFVRDYPGEPAPERQEAQLLLARVGRPYSPINLILTLSPSV